MLAGSVAGEAPDAREKQGEGRRAAWRLAAVFQKAAGGRLRDVSYRCAASIRNPAVLGYFRESNCRVVSAA
jgi:hypothetical protein